MKTNNYINRFISFVTLFILLTSNIVIDEVKASSNRISYPLKKVAKLECRFTDFDDLKSNCKEDLKILHSKDYEKYIKQNWGYNDYTRRYTELWWASYKYGWDVWFWGHQWVDIVSSKWTPVYSIADWKVIVAKKALGWWNVVTIEHIIDGRKVFSNYAHLDKILVKKGQKVRVGQEIWKIWSTWNSTWNHLHFQIDLDTPFHPFYYNYKTCPYSYYEITEKWVCFDELAQNTVDPIVFLETNWKILEKIKKVSRVQKSIESSSKITTTTKQENYNNNISIWNKTVYIGYSKSDIREVQQILRDLNLYSWDLTWNYKDIENIIFKYQLEHNIVTKKSDLWAWRFGPKTRARLKIDYDKFLKSWKKHNYVVITWNNSSSSYNIKKISRKQILTREEIEKREYENFIKSYNFELKLNKASNTLRAWQKANIKFSISKKYKTNKYFKGITPLDIKIISNEKILKVFPKKFSYMKDWFRDITLIAKSPWTTNVRILFGSQVIKTYNIKVYWKNEKIYLNSWKIYWETKWYLWDELKQIAIFSDKSNKRLIKERFSWTYKIVWENNAKVCIKSWSLKYISKIFSKWCSEEDYKKEIVFSYDDTISWILLYNVKSDNLWKAKVKIINTYNNKVLAWKDLLVTAPKWLDDKYVYKQDVIKALKENIASNYSKWYFMQDKAITEEQAKKWMINTLNRLKKDSFDKNLRKKIDERLAKLYLEKASKYKTLTRKQFLEKAFVYLNFDNNLNYSRQFTDFKWEDVKKLSIFFRNNNETFKDRFWKDYFQPDKKITRWEVAFLLNNFLNKQSKSYFTMR